MSISHDTSLYIFDNKIFSLPRYIKKNNLAPCTMISLLYYTINIFRRTMINILFRNILVATGFSVSLSACFGDYFTQIALTKDLNINLDGACIARTLRESGLTVRSSTYKSSSKNSRGFSGGILVNQISYAYPKANDNYSIDFAENTSGLTHYWHGWIGSGKFIADKEKVRVTPLLLSINQKIGDKCGIDFTNINLTY